MDASAGLSLEEVSHRFGVSRQAVLNWVVRGVSGVHLAAEREPHRGANGWRYVVSEAAVAEFAVATGLRLDQTPANTPTAPQVSTETIQLEFELAFERSARQRSEAELLVATERLSARTDEVERLQADVAALRLALEQQVQVLLSVTTRVGN